MGFFSKDIKSLDDLFVHTLRDIYYAEKQIEKALPKMIEKRKVIQKNIQIEPTDLLKVMSTGLLEPYGEFFQRNQRK